MVGLESSIEQAQVAHKAKEPKVSEAEKKRQEKFLALLRGRKAPQPKAKPKAKKAVSSKKAKAGYYRGKPPKM